MLAVSSTAIFVMDGRDQPVRRLPSRPFTHNQSPLWSSRGDRLAWTAIDLDYHRRHQIMGLAWPDGPLEPLSAPCPYIVGLDWLPDGQHLALFDMEGDAWFLSLLDTATAHVHRLRSIRTVVYTWSPDWTRLAVSPATTDPHLYLTDLSGTHQTPITDQLPHLLRMAWSPDGRSLACVLPTASGRALWVIGVDGTGLRKLADLAYESPIVWSPSSTALVVVIDAPAASMLAHIDCGTGQIRPLLPMHPDDLSGKLIPTAPVWIDDGQALLASSVVGDHYGLFRINPASALVEDITPDDAPESLDDLAWSAPPHLTEDTP